MLAAIVSALAIPMAVANAAAPPSRTDLAPTRGAESVPPTAAPAPSHSPGPTLDEVAAIFESSCVKCHSGSHAKLGLRLERDTFYRATVNVPARSSRRVKLVSPGDPDHSMLYLRLLPPSQGGYRGPQMPMGGHLGADRIETIRAWIESFPVEPWGPPESGPAPSRSAREVAAPGSAPGPAAEASGSTHESAAAGSAPGSAGVSSASSRAGMTPASAPAGPVLPAPLFFDSFTAQLPTPDPLGRKMLEFRFTHRFRTSAKDAGADGLYGLDGGAWISLGLAYGITEWLDVGMRRSDDLQDYEAYAKAALIRQDAESPLSVAFFGSRIRLDGPDLANRNRWTAQLVIARRFAEWLSVEMVPSYATRTDYLDEQVTTGTTALGFAAELRFKPYIAVTGETIIQFDGVKGPFRSATLGLELRTANHAFHVLLTNSRGTQTDLYLPGGDLDWRKNQFRLGFNISRTFDLAHD